MSSTVNAGTSLHERVLVGALRARAARGGLTAEAVVLAQGRLQAPAAWPAGLPRRRNGGAGFPNAWRIARRSTALAYVEGYVIEADGTVTRHAWCADEHGRALDPTWPDGRARAYAGIGMALGWVAAVQQRTCTRTRFPGVLDPTAQHTRDADRVLTYGVPPDALLPLGRDLPERAPYRLSKAPAAALVA
ncbi:hypothetical protein GCM10018790_54720 [Kitasatospora xanthocidica]|uniref:hypothetical protein n=1 Tax=Kitasatospora xanthocidica TaxID=83382 RepID=UPI00167A3516|nr:hypothetical protein [Kitasatospora xanthocidica]GHF69874.1 hypothetical protein GCM10018790_54720 [Kitasatospora xanthocidica]